MQDFLERKIGDLTVRIDRTICVGFGDCMAEAPDALELDEEGIAAFKAGAASVERERLLRACEACPVDALVVLDAEGNQLVPRARALAAPGGYGAAEGRRSE